MVFLQFVNPHITVVIELAFPCQGQPYWVGYCVSGYDFLFRVYPICILLKGRSIYFTFSFSLVNMVKAVRKYKKKKVIVS